MRRTFHALVLAVVFVALIAGAAMAKTFKGKVKEIDTAGGKITVAKMMIMKKTFSAESSMLQGIATGDKVTVEFEKSGDTNKASKIEKQ